MATAPQACGLREAEHHPDRTISSVWGDAPDRPRREPRAVAKTLAAAWKLGVLAALGSWAASSGG
jgi:hypothetical protein